MAKKIRNFAAILAVSAVVGTILLVLVFLLPVGPMRKNVEKSVGDMLKTGHFRRHWSSPRERPLSIISGMGAWESPEKEE